MRFSCNKGKQGNPRLVPSPGLGVLDSWTCHVSTYNVTVY